MAKFLHISTHGDLTCLTCICLNDTYLFVMLDFIKTENHFKALRSIEVLIASLTFTIKTDKIGVPSVVYKYSQSFLD